jgi:3-deoxy-D-manno-octulosonic-acid transferase
MIRLSDVVYLLAALIYSPVLLLQKLRHGKTRLDWSARLGRGSALPAATGPRVLVHAVSVGEVNAVRHFIAVLCKQLPGAEVVVATTTDTGLTRANTLFSPALSVVRYPLDLSGAVRRFLDRVRPDVIVLVELEIWPNMVAQAEQRGIPVAVINGRLSQRSARRYGLIKWLIRPVFSKIACAAAQSDEYAQRFRRFGVPNDRVYVTGNMKWDTADIADHVAGADALAAALGIDRTRPLVVAGSTAPGEDRLLHDATPAGVQLLCAPRRPEWFDPAANVLDGCARRSQGKPGSATDRFLLDTIGELRAAYALADVVVVGRTFVDMGGSDMMEPIALGKATVIGPYVSNFASTVEALKQGDGVLSTTAEALPNVLAELLQDAGKRAALAERGRVVIRNEQGASARNAALVIDVLNARTRGSKNPPPRN